MQIYSFRRMPVGKHILAAILLPLMLVSCSGGGGGGSTPPAPPPGGGGSGPNSYTISGTVSGLVGVSGGLEIHDGYEGLSINANGGFTFPTAIFSGFPYTVTVGTQPSAPAQVCTVANGSGTVSGPVTNVQVVCRNTISFTITGLAGTAVLQNNGGDNRTVNTNGTYTFSTTVATGSAYNVTVLSSTPAQQCTVTNGSGTANGNVTNIQAHCVNTINGMITGLNGTVVLQNNGGDNLTLSANGPFTFATSVETGNPYNVSVFTQPTGQTCLVIENGQGTAYGNVTNVQVACVDGQWTWMGGSSSPNQTGTYGTKGTAAPGNVPGGRYDAVSWTDSTNGNLWLFGGRGYPASVGISIGVLNDLWKYNIASGQWTWVSGADTNDQQGVYGAKGTAAASNVPGARERAVSWIDAAGNLWLFGGYGRASNGVYGELNDFWKFTVSSGQWTWVSGSNLASNLDVAPVYGTKGVAVAANVPGGRSGAASRADSSGNLWLFGGYGWDSANGLGPLNDLWKFNIASNQWTWVSGADITRQSGSYGTKGTASASNVPGARQSAMGWFDATNGNLWVFAGNGYDSSGSTSTNNLNDLWKFNIASGEWTWVSGANVGGQAGTYGTLGVVSASNVPGSRKSCTGQIDASGNLWLFGGSVPYGVVNDLWKYNIASDRWTWMNGSKLLNQSGVYGTLGAAGTGIRGARQADVSWIDGSGNQWFFGGYDGGHRNDLWRFK